MALDRRTKLLCIAVMIAIAIWASVLLTRPSQLTATFLDVGDGLCAVVRTPSGRVLVVDCGTSTWRDNASVGPKLAAPYLQSLGVDEIDVAILTHPHSDHSSGLPGLLKLEPARLVLDCETRRPSRESRVFIKAVKAVHARYRTARQGQVIDMGDGVKVRVLGPMPDAGYTDLNDDSTVLRITYKRAAILLTGDAGQAAEQDMIASNTNLRAQVLQVGHHGSRHATSAQWLSAVRPRIAVISCARRSRYGFPSRQTLDRLSSCGARTYTTGQYGAVTISTDGESIQVRTVRSPR